MIPSPRQSPSQIGAILLAAGASVRMGRPKQLLPVGGETLLARTSAVLLAAPVWPVIVALGANADDIRPQLARLPVIVVENEAWPEGMASSIRSGITTLQQFSRSMAGALIALCDQPALTSEMVARLVEEHRRANESIIAARYADRCGAPVLFPHAVFPELQALTGEQGARVVVDAHAAQVVAIDLPELAFDLDTPEQYEAWKKSAQA